MRKFVALEPPKDFDPRLYNILKNIQSALGQSQTGFARISRGEQPDGGGAPIIDDSRYVLLAGRDNGQTVRGSNRIVGTTGLSVLNLAAFNSASAASVSLDNADVTVEGARVVIRAPSHTDEPLLMGFSTSGSPEQNWVGLVLTGNVLINASSASTNGFGVVHANMPTTNVTAFVRKRSSQTGNLFEWQTGLTPMSYIRASDGAFVGPIVASGTATFTDDAFRILGSGDPTKILAFEVDGITTATTRTITVPDFDGTVALFRSDKLRIGDATAPTHRLELVAGSTSVAPILFTSGALLTTPVTGALEFLNNRLYSTSSVGPTRRIILMTNSTTALTSGRIPVAITAGEITNYVEFAYSDGTKTLNVLGRISANSGGSTTPLITSQGGLNVTGKANFGFGINAYSDDTNIKLQSQYLDTSTGAVNITGLSSKLRVEPASSSAANFIAMDGYAAVSSAAITPSGIGVGVVGLRGVVEINTSSTIDSVTGLTGLIYTSGGGPTITNAFAIGVRWSHTSGTITNAYGIYIQDPASSVTVTNNYMLYLENAQEGTTLNYSIYAAGGPSIHVGSLRLGDTTTATHRLEIAPGTTAIAPIKLFHTGNLLTTPEAGCLEYDNVAFYLTLADAVRSTVVTQNGAVNLTGQGAAIGATTLYTVPATGGYFVVHYTLETTTAGAGAGTIQFQVNYTDDIGATNQTGALLALTATGRDRGSFQVFVAGGGNITYQTNNVGGFGAGGLYALRVRLERLGV